VAAAAGWRYEAALAWMRTVYDDTSAVDRKIYYGLVLDETIGGGGPSRSPTH
jgi:hypothetical protein